MYFLIFFTDFKTKPFTARLIGEQLSLNANFSYARKQKKYNVLEKLIRKKNTKKLHSK